MQVNRREALASAGGVLAGGAVTAAGLVAKDRADASGPLPFYGSPVSAIRPDLSRPGAAGAAVVWRAETRERVLALTFDDGPHPEWTPKVLAALEAEDVPATFFCKGVNVRDHGSLHRGSLDRHELGNHTWDHPDLGRLAYPAVVDQLRRCSEEMERAYGRRPTLFRPPYGHVGGSTVLAAAEAGLTTVLWSTQLHEDRHVGRPAGIVDEVAASVHPGAVVLGHDNGPRVRLVAIDNLRGILARLRADGWAFRTVSGLLGQPAPPR